MKELAIFLNQVNSAEFPVVVEQSLTDELASLFDMAWIGYVARHVVLTSSFRRSAPTRPQNR